MTASKEEHAARMRKENGKATDLHSVANNTRTLKREKTVTPKELSELSGYSVSTVLKLIKHDPAVHRLKGRGQFTGKRMYHTYKIPESHAIIMLERLRHDAR